MKNSTAQLGCLSPSAFIAAIVTAVVIVAALYSNGGLLFSSGELNAHTGETLGGVSSHAGTEGECSACHTAPWSTETMADRCVTCHTGVAVEINSGSGLHGILAQPSALQGTNTFIRARGGNVRMQLALESQALSCRECHPEHRGAEAALIEVDLVDFPHDDLGFSLRAHPQKSDNTSFTCSDCHQGEYDEPYDVSTCVTCHFSMDAVFTKSHSLVYSLDCLNCHDGLETLASDFDHSLLLFPLKGSHTQAACQDCHEAATTFADFKLTSQNCFDCHKDDDAHQGALGENCAACHSEEAWEQTHVDHSQFAFPLTGAHQVVDCEACHQNEIFKGTPQDCASCHLKDEPHAGRFGTDCAACHTTAAWEPASFDHNLSVFKLTGAHVTAACESCHVNNVFQGTPQECIACHRSDDKHNGQFGANCAACHTTDTWAGAAFDHNLAAFKLTGAHVAVTCEQCHVNGVFKGTPQDCVTCHRSDDKHNGSYGTNCAACHSTSSWKGASFDHSLSGFPLTGRHVNLACDRCHVGGVYSGLASACVSCHADPAYHAGMFGTNCASCHTTNNWSAAYRGQHPSIADEGGSGVNHGNTTCRTCHTASLHSATCTACHDGNNFENDGGGDGGDDD